MPDPATEPPFVCPYGHRDDEPCLVRDRPDLDWPTATEPPFDSSDEAERRLLRESIGDGCCGTDAWRGHLCQYHSGFRDGLEAAFQWVREADGE